MNGAALALGIASWKPALTALVLPPVPLIAAMLVGAWLLPRRRVLGGWLVLAACLLQWLLATNGIAELIVHRLVLPPPALDISREAARLRDTGTRRATAVVVLGGGRDRFAPEYAAPSLAPPSLERLRYGVWLGRRLDVPLAFTGGVGHGAAMGHSEAEIAAHVAAHEFGRTLRWQETASRDTRENAEFTLPLLARDGVRRIVLVTHGWHMPRAQRAFSEAAARSGLAMEIVPAPMALAPRQDEPLLRWLPSGDGALLVRQALREWLGRLAGA